MMKSHLAALLMLVSMFSELPECTASEGNCLRIVQYIYHSLGLRHREIENSNLAGEWTSSSCEVRPGPQFFTRYITIFRNATWEGYFHHYNDSQCSEPKSSLYVSGYLKFSVDPNKVHFNFTRVDAYPHNEYEQQKMVNVSNRHCPNSLRVLRTLRSGIDVLEVNVRAFKKRACRNAFGLSESEFSILKLESRRKKGSKYDKLYFAEIPTTRVTRRYRPKSYQLPLQRYNANNCTICVKIQSGTAVRPPKLPQTLPRAVRLEGEWASTTCESTPSGVFQTRHFKFNRNLKKWECHYFFYYDSDCKKLEFILKGKGHFTDGIPSKIVAGAYDYVFTMTHASITPTDSFITQMLNTGQENSEICGEGRWKTNVAQDITSTSGCTVYGISLPHTEYDLLKMETNHEGNRLLFVGQRASDGKDPTSPSRRPTSFHMPLVECSSFRFKFVPPTTRPTTRLTTRPRPFPTFREKTSTTRRRTDRETIGKATSKKNEQIGEIITKKPGDVELAYRSSAFNWSLCNQLLTLATLFIFVVA